jgi:multiple antibiotic resistance protein
MLSAAMILFLVMDPIGNTACFSILLKDVDARRHRWIVLREGGIALLILVIFLFAGRELLRFLDISQASLAFRGGHSFPDRDRHDFPRFDRPFYDERRRGTFHRADGYSSGGRSIGDGHGDAPDGARTEKWLDWLLALLLAWCASSVILLFSKQVGHLLGNRGLAALTRLMGMILIIVAVEMLIKGINQAFLH